LRSSKTYASFIYADKDLTLSGQYAMDALALAKQSGKQWLVGYAHAVLGYWARENKVEVDEFFHFLEGEKLLKIEGAEEYYGNVLAQLALCQKDRENFQAAFTCLESALVIFKKIGNVRLHAINAISLGRLYRAQKEYVKAEKHYLEALSLTIEHSIEYERAAVNVFLGHLYRDIKQNEKSILHFENAITLWGDTIRPSTKADIAKHLHTVYYKNNDLEKAYQTLLDYTEIRLKLQDENRIKETALLQTKYETEKREAELREVRLQQTESELKALKAQMNPHFIFNALNSIQEIFFLGDKRLANKHLARFSQLMRSILKASSQKAITLDEEITMLREYLMLEGLRFGEAFSFEISMDDNVDPYTFDVPPMIIQPFVENAVKHGLLHKEGNQKSSCISVLMKKGTV
jgi:tetratricopeptide (TPR) repeat protein